MVFDETDFDNHDGLFAVPREEWEASPDFDDAIQNRLREEEQQRREAAFLPGDHRVARPLSSASPWAGAEDLRDISGAPFGRRGVPGRATMIWSTAPLTSDTLQQPDQLGIASKRPPGGLPAPA